MFLGGGGRGWGGSRQVAGVWEVPPLPLVQSFVEEGAEDVNPLSFFLLQLF